MERMFMAAIAAALILGGALAAPPVESDPVLPGGADVTSSPANPGGGITSSPAADNGTVPSLPVEWQGMSCDLHFAGVTFGGLRQACIPHHRKHHRHHHHRQNLRSYCCPVLATWLYTAQAETVMQAGSSSCSTGSCSGPSSTQVEMPVPPDDSAVCAASLQQGLQSQGIDLPVINASCDMSLCYCGIRLRQMASLSCPVEYFFKNRTAILPSQKPFLKSLQRNCSNSSYTGCVNCITALDNSMNWAEQKTAEKQPVAAATDCRLMGLMWLLSTNRTRYVPTVSAVLRALVYSDSSSNDATEICSRDEANMPLARDVSDTSAGSRCSLHCWMLVMILLGFVCGL